MFSRMNIQIPLTDEDSQALFAECEPGETLTFTVTANNGTSLDGELEKDYEAAPETEAAPAPMAKKMPKALVVAIGK